jgi:transposase
VRRWLADWIKNPDHRMIDARYAYFSRGNRSRWVPLAAFLEANSNNASAAAREFCLSRSSVTTMIQQLEASRCGVVYLGTKSADSRRAFDTDRRFPSISAFGRLTGVNFTNSPRSNLLRDLIDEAREAQLSQSEYGRPNDDLYLESKYRAAQNILSDPASGKTVLNLAEALFVTFKNQMSVCHKVDPERVQAVSFGQFNNWLAGYARDRGTDRPGEAVCARLDIFDPRTEEPAKLTNHDFRHWLETAYENGGLSQTQIATLFNRSSTKANAGYDQTNSKLRRERLKDALTDGFLLGHAAEAYVQIAKNSPEEAADYLEAATKFYNPMPHGICRLNWAMEPCPHALSCFSCGDAQDDASEPCEHLIIDIANRAQIEEIARIHRNAQSIAQIMYEDGANGSPQFAQFQRIARSTRFILDKVGRP